VTAIADLLAAADRECLLERLAELGDLAGLMRERGTLAAVPEPVPLHRAGRNTAERTTRS
jgi:hypothetical protein